MSKQITTEVPMLLLRHPIRERLAYGLHWLATLHEKHFNGILADEMGLGKTIMTIALLAHLAVQKEVWGPHLVVVPTSLLMNWVKELQKWAPGLKVCAYYGTVKERRDKRRGWGGEDAFHVCVASYAVVLQDLRPLKMKRWHYLILDEAQNIKNCRSQKWQQLMRFRSERRLLLTGTPLQNNLTELWSLLHFLMPDMFQSYSDFKEFFADPLHLAMHEQRVKQDLVMRLHKVIRPFMLRRLKSEVERQLPQKHEHLVPCRLSRRQQVLYEEFMKRRQTQLILKKGDYLKMMSKLR
ncbi:SRCAP [Symbiodinium pilosum]|uniref:SRCAP protein n=1 Tax=Symbiodinium pilosum TaxID=2952 RepID=A0A812QEA1_SYMPI|nr:SRCAP [Symbiodinium pilosum]